MICKICAAHESVGTQKKRKQISLKGGLGLNLCTTLKVLEFNFRGSILCKIAQISCRINFSNVRCDLWLLLSSLMKKCWILHNYSSWAIANSLLLHTYLFTFIHTYLAKVCPISRYLHTTNPAHKYILSLMQYVTIFQTPNKRLRYNVTPQNISLVYLSRVKSKVNILNL